MKDLDRDEIEKIVGESLEDLGLVEYYEQMCDDEEDNESGEHGY